MQSLSYNLVRFDPFKGLGVIAGQSGFGGFRSTFGFFQAEVDVTRDLLASISGRVEGERFELES